MIPGEYFLRNEPIEINANRPAITIVVTNTGDRPVQVGSHFHFFEVNKQMEFERQKAFGHRLDIPAGTAVRFEPGEEKVVSLVPFGGQRKLVGFNNLSNGITSAEQLPVALKKMQQQNFKNKKA